MVIRRGFLALVIVSSFFSGGNAMAAGAGPGESCDPTIPSPCDEPNYICKKKLALDQQYNYVCQCAWGNFEVGLFDIKAGTSICDYINKEGLPGYIQVIITAIMALTIIAAMVCIVIGGYYYMTAGGSADRVRTAKVWVGSAILGIIIAMLAWLILNAISPNLV